MRVAHFVPRHLWPGDPHAEALDVAVHVVQFVALGNYLLMLHMIASRKPAVTRRKQVGLDISESCQHPRLNVAGLTSLVCPGTDQ